MQLSGLLADKLLLFWVLLGILLRALWLLGIRRGLRILRRLL